MATTAINSTIKAKQIAVPAQLPSPSEMHGRVRVMIDKAKTAVGDAASTITFAKLPKGAKVLCGWVYAADENTALTFALGDGTTADKFLAAYSVATGPVVTFFPDAAASIAAGGLDMGEKSFVITTGGAAMTGNADVTLIVLYVID